MYSVFPLDFKLVPIIPNISFDQKEEKIQTDKSKESDKKEKHTRIAEYVVRACKCVRKLSHFEMRYHFMCLRIQHLNET